MSKKIFALRLSLYALFGVALPVGFLAWRFQLFSKVTKMSFSIWGLIAIVVIAIFVLKLFNGLYKGMKFGIAKQAIGVVCKVTIPLLVVMFAFDWVSSFATQFIQFLIVLTICETIAGVVNPLPQWRLENGIEATTGIVKQVLSGAGIIKK